MISFHFHVYDSFCDVPFCPTQRSPWWLKRSVLDPPGRHSLCGNEKQWGTKDTYQLRTSNVSAGTSQ